MKKIVKIAGILVVLLVLVFVGLTVFVSTLDADKYRPQLVDLLSKKTGRTVKLNGPIAFSFGVGGIKISIQDASIGNPTWASRPNMAGMGKFEVGVGLIPLLTHTLDIKELSIENADILLETNAAGKHNWDFGPTATSKSEALKAEDAATMQPMPVETNAASGEQLSIDKLSIVNSQLAMRDATGKVSSYNVASLTLGQGLGGAELKFKGDANGTPITLDVKTGIKNLLSKAAFDFDGELAYNEIHLTAKGNADIAGSKADISAYQVTAGKTVINGSAAVTWGGPRPQIHGVMNSDHVDLADFKSDDDDKAPASSKEAAVSDTAKNDGRMFSDAALPLSGLRAVDAELDIAIGTLPLGRSALTEISAKLVLFNGNLNLAPVRASVGTSPIEIQLKLDASGSPAHLVAGVIANSVDLGDLQKLGDMSPFMTGKAGANIQLSGEGDSAHALASSLGGILTITAEKGEILTGAAAGISSALAAVFNPQGGNAALNCLAARFTAKSGVLTDNGILIDSTPSTVSGKGSINLALETVNLTLHANTKLVDVGGLMPAVQISGTLEHPSYSVDAEAVVKNALTSLVNGNLDIAASSVPAMQTAPTGQNACVYTLDHPKAPTAAGSSILPSEATGKINQKVQSIGNSLKGLFGK
jgi:uncharacterized protein involved in outer membrane biogenesis